MYSLLFDILSSRRPDLVNLGQMGCCRSGVFAVDSDLDLFRPAFAVGHAVEVAIYGLVALHRTVDGHSHSITIHRGPGSLGLPDCVQGLARGALKSLLRQLNRRDFGFPPRCRVGDIDYLVASGITSAAAATAVLRCVWYQG